MPFVVNIVCLPHVPGSGWYRTLDGENAAAVYTAKEFESFMNACGCARSSVPFDDYANNIVLGRAIPMCA